MAPKRRQPRNELREVWDEWAAGTTDFGIFSYKAANPFDDIWGAENLTQLRLALYNPDGSVPTFTNDFTLELEVLCDE